MVATTTPIVTVDRDRDGDGVPNRRDMRPDDPRRYKELTERAVTHREVCARLGSMVGSGRWPPHLAVANSNQPR
jgi:hypothetical protein